MKKHHDLKINLYHTPYPVLQLPYPDATDLTITTIITTTQTDHKRTQPRVEGVAPLRIRIKT